jgi:hypothetical protein
MRLIDRPEACIFDKAYPANSVRDFVEWAEA